MPQSQRAGVWAPHSIPPPERQWSDTEWNRIAAGLVPLDMDDRWFVYVEDHTLYVHRSWTGFGIFEARFQRTSSAWFMASAFVSGDPEQYRRSSDAYESLFLLTVIDHLVLHLGCEHLLEALDALRLEGEG